MTLNIQNPDVKILPPPLKPGDLLRVVAPSGTLREWETFNHGVEIWRSHGYRVEIPTDIKNRWGYLAGTDKNRREQLADAWQDPDCRGILCARGGFGSTRLLENWHWPNNSITPKWLIGFSDVTVLLWSLYTNGISSVHAPVLTTVGSEPDWSIERLFAWVEGRPLPPIKGSGWGGGVTTGILLPGNLTVATHLFGTALQPNYDGVILAFEDVSEAPYRIDRMLTQWRSSGALAKVKGIALGSFTQCEVAPNIPSLSVEEVLRIA